MFNGSLYYLPIGRLDPEKYNVVQKSTNLISAIELGFSNIISSNFRKTLFPLLI